MVLAREHNSSFVKVFGFELFQRLNVSKTVTPNTYIHSAKKVNMQPFDSKRTFRNLREPMFSLWSFRSLHAILWLQMLVWELHSVIFTPTENDSLTSYHGNGRQKEAHSHTRSPLQTASWDQSFSTFLSLRPIGRSHVTTWVTSGAQIATSVSLTHSLAPLAHSAFPCLQEAPSLFSPSPDSIKWLKSCVKNTERGKQDEGGVSKSRKLTTHESQDVS